MDIKDKRRKLADMAVRVNELDYVIDSLNHTMKGLTGDDVESDSACLMLVWDKKNNVDIRQIIPATVAPPQVNGPDDIPVYPINGVNIVFQVPLSSDTVSFNSVTMDQNTLIKAITNIRNNLRKKLKCTEAEIQELQTKKGARS